MSWTQIKALFTEHILPFLNFELLRFGETSITIGGVILAAVTLVLATWIAGLIDRAMERALDKAGINGRGRASSARRLVRYVVLVVGFVVALGTMGININALFTAGAIFAVGIGFAMQNISQNFVSGVILLLERTITPGDILEVEGTVVRIEEMNIRSTVARNRDDEQLIIPNATLAQSTVKNLTLGDNRKRVRAEVGVAYGTDLVKTLAVLQKAAALTKKKAEEIEPVVVLKAYADSSIVFEASVWTHDPWDSINLKSRLLFEMGAALQAADITIAFPQLDVHFDPPVMQAIAVLKAMQTPRTDAPAA